MSPSASRTDDLLRLAALRRPHGLAGEISTELLGEFPEMLSPGARILWSGPHENRELEVESCRPAGKRLLLKFAGWEGRDRAAELCGGFLCVARGALERPSPDFLFEDEVAQYACVSPTGEMLGQASAFRRFGPGVFLEMIHAGRPCLVPYASPIVVEVDRSERRIVLDPPEGLFDI